MTDTKWLVESYNNGKTIQQLADIIGRSYTFVRNTLLANKVAVRGCHYSRRIKCGFPKELEDCDWLREQYINKKKSLTSIAKDIGATHSNVRSALMRNGISVRGKSEGQRVRYKQSGYDDYFVFNKPVLEGCLLGDGFLKITNPIGVDVFPVFAKRNIYLDHLEFVAKTIFSKDSHKRIKDRGNLGGFSNGKRCVYELSTLSHKELLDLYRDWYPASNQHKKIIPESISINKNMLLHWFLDDGYSYFVTKNKKYKYIRVQFATMCFEKPELDMLCSKINSILGLKLYPRFHQRNGKVQGTGYFLELSQSHVCKFFDTIGRCPVSSMQYKWKTLS